MPNSATPTKLLIYVPAESTTSKSLTANLNLAIGLDAMLVVMCLSFPLGHKRNIKGINCVNLEPYSTQQKLQNDTTVVLGKSNKRRCDFSSEHNMAAKHVHRSYGGRLPLESLASTERLFYRFHSHSLAAVTSYS
jgi:hypothetical protein